MRHVILIVIDALRADMLSCYSASAPPTPHLDALAADALRFEHALAPAPWTLPAMASIMTGLPASVHGAIANDSRVPAGVPTLAERMKDAGYATAAIVDNPALAPARGLAAGFDRYVHYPRTTLDNSFGTAILAWLFPARYREELTTDHTTGLVTDFVDANANA